MATRTLYPTIAPSLDLNFAGSKTLDPRITFSRASAATYYDGKTVAKAEENLFTYSEQFDNAAWTKYQSTVTANAAAAPDGATMADLVVASAVSDGHAVLRPGSTSGVSYTASIYAKASGYNYIFFEEGVGGSKRRSFFNISTGVVGTANASHTVSVSSAGNGWYRCSITYTAVTTGDFVFGVSNADNTTVFVGDGTSGIYIWGAQLEQRSQVTAYTPTTTQPITNYIPVLQTAPAGVPRFDHNPVTGESLGLLVEEQRTNLLTRSQEFDILWGKIGSAVLTNILVSPDGTLSADKIIADTTSSSHRVDSGVVLAQNSSYTFSCFAKVGEYGGIAFNVAGGSASATYNLIAGTVTGAGGTVDAGSVSAAIQPVGNGWYRCIFSFTWLNAAITNTSIRVCLANSATNTAGQPSFTGDGYSGVYIWGAQIEVGTFPTSYIKTEASQVTRAADTAQMLGTNFSSWYRQDEGTLFVESILRSIIPTDSYVASIQGVNIDNSIRLGHLTNGAARRFNVRANAANTVAMDIFPASAVNTVYKQSAGYKVNDFATSANGSAVSTAYAGFIPSSVDNLRIGSSAQYVRRISYYPKRLTDAQLQALTA